MNYEGSGMKRGFASLSLSLLSERNILLYNPARHPSVRPSHVSDKSQHTPVVPHFT